MKIFSNDYIVILVAALCATIFFLPHILIPLLRGDDLYSPVVVKGVNAYAYDQAVYASYIKDVTDGHFPVRDPTVWENKEKPSIIVSAFPTLILGLMSIALDSVYMTFIVSSFIFPFLIFLLIYFFVNKATKSRNMGILSACFLMIGFNFIARPPITPGNIYYFFINYILHPVEPLNYLNRLPAVQFNFLFLMASIISLYFVLERKNIKYSILGGVLLGILFYTYIYYWVGLSIAIVLLLLLSICKKDRIQIKNIAFILLIAALMSIPYWLEYYSFKSSSYYYDIVSKIGATEEFSEFSGFQTLLTLKYSIFYALFACFVKKRDSFFWLITSIFIAGIIGLNAGVVAGFNLQYGHFDVTFLAPITAIAIIYIFREISLSRYKNRALSLFSLLLRNNVNKICALLVLTLLVFGFYTHTAYSLNVYKNFGVDKSYREAYDWFNKNTEVDSVVVTMSTEQNLLLPAYTHNNVYIPNGAASLSTTEESAERLFTVYKFFNVSRTYIEDLMDNDNAMAEYSAIDREKREFNLSLFDKTYWDLYVFHLKLSKNKDAYVYPPVYGETKRDDIYRHMLDYYENLEANLKRYRADYLLVSDFEHGVANFTIPDDFELLWSNDKVSIYRI